jgi:hypothetical protein
MPPDIEERLRTLELDMPEDLDARLRTLEVNTALLPEMNRQLSALQGMLTTYANEGRDRGENMMGIYDRLTTIENEHNKCFKTTGTNKEIITQVGEWAIKLAAIGGLAYAFKEGFVK